jgi:uncharacterized membrane protein (DUF2068 family)
MHQKSTFLSWVVAFKVVKSVLLGALGAFLLGYLHRDPVQVVVSVANTINLSSTSTMFYRAVSFATHLTTRRQVALALTAFGYSALLGTEAVGLALRRSWARWFTIGMTASLLPFEVYEIIRRPGEPIRIATLVVNIFVLVYLIQRKEVFEP